VKVPQRPRLAVQEQREVKEALKRLQARSGLKTALRVERLAKRAQLHPDPDIAAAALQWARAILSAEPRYTNRPLFLCYLTEILTAGFNQDGTRAFHERRSLRVAHRIVRAHETTVDPSG
jgi:acetyl-CoA carboxylase alpha subunit